VEAYHSGSNVAEIFRGMVAEHRFDGVEAVAFPSKEMFHV